MSRPALRAAIRAVADARRAGEAAGFLTPHELASPDQYEAVVAWELTHRQLPHNPELRGWCPCHACRGVGCYEVAEEAASQGEQERAQCYQQLGDAFLLLEDATQGLGMDELARQLGEQEAER